MMMHLTFHTVKSCTPFPSTPDLRMGGQGSISHKQQRNPPCRLPEWVLGWCLLWMLLDRSDPSIDESLCPVNAICVCVSAVPLERCQEIVKLIYQLADEVVTPVSFARMKLRERSSLRNGCWAGACTEQVLYAIRTARRAKMSTVDCDPGGAFKPIQVFAGC
jgi:hypothetical protein